MNNFKIPQVIFVIAAALVCNGCADRKEAQSYVADQVKKIDAEPHTKINGSTKAAETYAYWQKAIKEVEVCRDFVPSVSMEDKRAQNSWFYIGNAVTQELRNIPTQDVDADAVKSVQMVADTFDDLRKIDKFVKQDASAVGSAIGGGLARGLGGTGGAAAGAGASAASGDIATEMALSNATKTILSNADLIGLRGIGGLIKGSKAERKLELATDAKLKASQEILEKRYGTSFPEFAITSRVTSYQYSGQCGINILQQ